MQEGERPDANRLQSPGSGPLASMRALTLPDTPCYGFCAPIVRPSRYDDEIASVYSLRSVLVRLARLERWF